MTNIVSKLTGVAAFSAAVAAALLQIYLRKQKTAHAGTLLRRAVIPRTTLTPHTIAVIRATAPVISRHVSEIVNRFYEIFFARHPEMRSLFSLSHGGGALEESDRDAPTRAMAVCPVRKNNSRKNVTGTCLLSLYPSLIGAYVTIFCSMDAQACRRALWPTPSAHTPLSWLTRTTLDSRRCVCRAAFEY